MSPKTHKKHKKHERIEESRKYKECGEVPKAAGKHSSVLRRVWHFLWEENSVWSWIANIVLAFVIIKFLFYPGLGLVLGTKYPVVAVVSGSMEHEYKFNEWYSSQELIYSGYNISRDDFEGFKFSNGFNKGDIIILKGVKPESVRVGDVVVFRTSRKDPVIHRVVEIKMLDDQYFFHTKGDHNLGSLEEEVKISSSRLIGRAKFKIPAFGWVKIWFSDFANWMIGR